MRLSGCHLRRSPAGMSKTGSRGRRGAHRLRFDRRARLDRSRRGLRGRPHPGRRTACARNCARRDGNGDGLGRRRLGSGLRRGRRRSGRAGGKEKQRIEVPVRVGRQADAEVHVRLGPLRLAAGADRADDLPLVDGRPHADSDRSQVHERDRVAVCGADRQALPLARDRSRERDDAGRRRAHVASRRRRDVDSPVLPGSVGILAADERPQHRPIHGPAPRRRHRGEREQGEKADQDAVA